MPPLAEQTSRHVTKRLMPFLMVVYLFAYIDRANVGIAKLGMNVDLGFDDSTIGFGAGIFFIGYFLLELPATLIVEKWSARKLLSIIMIVWGLVAAATGLVSSAKEFFVLRFLLGVAESGFFPGVIVYLSHWYRVEDRARAKTYFMMTQPLAILLGFALSRWILETVHWQGMASWRWVFLLEGIPSVVLGVFSFFYLTDRPEQARWLAQPERDWLSAELTREAEEKSAAGRVDMMAALRQPFTLLLIAIYFLIVSSNQGLIFFLPSLVNEIKTLSITMRTGLTMLPYAIGIGTIWLTGLSAQRTGERRWHTATPMLLSGVALTSAIFLQSHLALATACLILAAGTSQAFLPSFWTLPTSYLGKSAAATAVALINSFGSLGGFAGPYAFGLLRTTTKTWQAGLWALTACALAAGFLAASIRVGAQTSRKIERQHESVKT